MQDAVRLMVVLVALSASYSEAAADGPTVDCNNATSTVEMNVCSERDYQKADAALNAAYQRALARIPAMAADDKPFDAKSWERALRQSQRAWIAFRDAECKDHVPMFWTGGTGTTVAVYGCLIDKTKARTRELVENYEGGR